VYQSHGKLQQEKGSYQRVMTPADAPKPYYRKSIAKEQLGDGGMWVSTAQQSYHSQSGGPTYYQKDPLREGMADKISGNPSDIQDRLSPSRLRSKHELAGKVTGDTVPVLRKEQLPASITGEKPSRFTL
jgi:hypothetical protein